LKRWLPVEEHRLVLALLVCGALVRIAWLASRTGLAPVVDEMQRVAASYARAGSLADAYFDGSGLTAHVGPIQPIILGSVYRLFGVATPGSEAVLIALAISFVLVGIYFLWCCFRELELPAAWRLAAVAVAALLPLHFNLELRALRTFEGAFATALMACGLLLVLRLDKQPRLGWRDLVWPSLLGAVLFLLNPPCGLGFFGALGVLVLRRVPVRDWAMVALSAAVALVLTVAPWGLRNQAVFGQPIFTRGNFGLEYAVGFHPAAASALDPKEAFKARMLEVHPYMGERARAAYVRDGEVRYMERLKQETDAWIAAHPKAAIELAARHVGNFWFPSRWMWGVFLEPGASQPNGVPVRQAIAWLMSLAALAALGWRLLRQPLGPHLYVACIVMLPSLPYALVEPTLRYRYIVETMCVFLSAELASRVLGAVRLGRQRALAGG